MTVYTTPVYRMHVILVACHQSTAPLHPGHSVYRADYEVLPPTVRGDLSWSALGCVDFATASSAQAHALAEARLLVDSRLPLQ